jgi:hypothetical protein
MKSRTININEIKSSFSYNEESGEIIRIKFRGHPSNIKTLRKASKSRYPMIGFNGSSYLAHRIAWVIKTGENPTFDIDHINGNKWDNRWCNLRIATRSENRCNCEPSLSNTSGTIGVTFHKLVKKYVAQIKKHGKSYHLGCFENIEDAIKCRKNAEKIFHGEFLSRDKQKTINE